MRVTAFVFVIITATVAAGCADEICPGLANCSGTCADLDTSLANCGVCGNACVTGQICVEGACVDFDCVDECSTLGELRCADAPENGIVVCADFVDDDDCLEWGGFTPCGEGATCVDGICAGGCENECPVVDQRQCHEDGYRVCGNHDGDACLEWSEVTSCEADESCSSGMCSTGCVDDCEEEGDRTCDGNGVRTCGEFDSDDCLDWSDVDPCDEEDICIDGECERTQCIDEGDDCPCGDDLCCEGHCCPVLYICVSFSPDEDFCPFGRGPHG